MAPPSGSGSGSPMRLSSSCQSGLALALGSFGALEATSQPTLMVVGRHQQLAGSWQKASVPHDTGLSTGLLTRWQPAFLRVRDERKERERECPSKMEAEVFL